MTDSARDDLITFYDTHPINEDEILAKAAASGKNLDALTQPDLQNLDQDHYGGTRVTDIIAEAAGIQREHHVLDVCSGMGGPARWLAYHRHCRVTGIDLTLSRVQSARRLTHRVKLQNLVDFVHGDATAMPLASSRYDVVISQESWLHVPNKTALIAECTRVLKPTGTLAFTDVVVKAGFDAIAEARVTADIHTSNLATAAQYRSLLESNGCEVQTEEDLSGEWRAVLLDRLQMYRSLRDTTEAKFGAEHFRTYDDGYSHFVNCFVEGKLGGVRMTARKAATPLAL